MITIVVQGRAMACPLAIFFTIFVLHVKPETSATANTETLPAAGAGDAFIAGAHPVARPADQAGD